MVKDIKSPSDIEPDEIYFPSEVSDAYLDEGFFAALSTQVRNKYASADEVIRNIEEIERIHKRGVCSEVSNIEAEKQMESILLRYRNKHLKWIHHEEAYTYFYNLLNGKDVF